MQSVLTIKELRDALKRVPFYPSLDLLTVEDDGLCVGVSGSMAYAYSLTGICFKLFDDAEIETFFGDVRKMLNQLPEGIAVTFLSRSENRDAEVVNRYQRSVSAEGSVAEELLRRELMFFDSKPFVKKELLLFLNVAPKEAHSFGLKKNHQVAHEQLKKTLVDAETVLSGGLVSLGMKMPRLSKMEIIRIHYERLNPSLSRVVGYGDAFRDDPVSYPRFETLRSRLLLHPPRVTHDSIYMDGFYHSVANLRTLPASVDHRTAELFSSSLPEDSEWIVTFRKPEQEKERGRLRVKANLAHAAAFFRFSEDHFAREKASQFESYLAEMAEKGEQAFEMSMSVLVRAKSERDLQVKREAVLNAFPKLGGAIGIFDHYEHDKLFLSHLPLHSEMNQMKFPVLTNGLSFSLPIHSNWTGSENPQMLLKTHDNKALSLDLFDPHLPAKHAVMIGSTGSGKSFSANYLLAHFLAADMRNHVVVIDMGGSYRKLARIFEGNYLEIDCTEEYAMNLFPVKKRLFPESGKFDSDLLAFLTTLLEKMVTEGEKLKSADLRIIEKAITKTYESMREDAKPLLGHLRRVLENFSLGDDDDKKRAYQFSKSLAIWTEGRFGKILNQEGRLSLDHRFIVFDLGKLAHHPELQSILFFVIRSAISRKLDDLSLRKMIVIDEGWRFFSDQVGSRLIEELYRTARKTNGLVLSISQSPEDFLESRSSAAILSNSYVKYILKLQKGHELLSRFDLNPNELAACRGLELKPGVFSELFIKFFDRGVTAKIEPSPLDYWIATTDPEDLIEEERCAKENPQLKRLECLLLLSTKFPNGVRRERMAVHA